MSISLLYIPCTWTVSMSSHCSMYRILMKFVACIFPGDVFKRLCTAGEFQFYFSSLLQSGSGNLKLNKNCNLSTWLSGCQPGWACTVGEQKIDLLNYDDLPDRTNDCQPCCEGFFCPHGLTCMMRKSLHFYKLNILYTHAILYKYDYCLC